MQGLQGKGGAAPERKTPQAVVEEGLAANEVAPGTIGDPNPEKLIGLKVPEMNSRAMVRVQAITT